MPNEVQVRIAASDETGAAIAQVTSRLNSFKTAGGEAGNAIDYSMKRARESARLTAETIGVSLPRALSSVIAESRVLGPLLASAFSIVAVVAFAEVIGQAAKKMSDLVADTFIFTSAMKALEKQQLAANQEIAKSVTHVNELQKAFALIGLEGTKLDVAKLIQIGEESKKLELQENILRDKMYFLRLENKAGTDQYAALSAQVGVLHAKQKELEQESQNLGKQTVVDQLHEHEQAAAKAAAAFAKLQAHIAAVTTEVAGIGRRVFDANHSPIEQITRDWQETFDKLLKIIATESPKLSGKAAELILPSMRAMNKQIEDEESKLLDAIQKDIEARFKDQAFPIALPKNLNPLGNVSTDFSGFQRAGEFAADLQRKMLPLITLNDSLSQSFDTMFGDIANNTRDISQAFASMASSVASSLLRMVAKMIFTATIGKWLEGIIKRMFFASIPSTPVPFIDAVLPDHLAGGGRYSAGMPRIVGESGMELDIPDHSGTIIPNDKLSGIGGATSVQVIINNNSSTPVSATASKPRFDGRRMVQEIILEDFRSNGPIRQALGGM